MTYGSFWCNVRVCPLYDFFVRIWIRYGVTLHSGQWSRYVISRKGAMSITRGFHMIQGSFFVNLAMLYILCGPFYPWLVHHYGSNNPILVQGSQRVVHSHWAWSSSTLGRAANGQGAISINMYCRDMTTIIPYIRNPMGHIMCTMYGQCMGFLIIENCVYHGQCLGFFISTKYH
jgi:hypothetical protein